MLLLLFALLGLIKEHRHCPNQSCICDHAGRLLTGKQKPKENDLWPKKWWQSLKKFEQWLLTRVGRHERVDCSKKNIKRV